MIERNFVKEKIVAGHPVLGTWNTLASPLVTELLAHSGLDFVIVDFEHGPINLGSIHDYVVRAERHGCSPIIRLPAPEGWMVLQALDQGAHGVLVPHVETPEAARQIVEASRYRPRGSRGFSPFPRAGGFNNRRSAEYVERAREFPLIAVLVESLQGLDRLAEIAETPGVDVVYFGAYDLSQDFGVPGEIRHPKVIEAIRSGARIVAGASKCPGAFVAESREDIAWLLGMGIRFITYDVDTGIISRVVEDMTSWFRHEVRSEK